MFLYRLVFALFPGLLLLGAGVLCPAASLEPKGSMGGSVRISHVSGNTAYVCEGASLVILDITDRDHPKAKSRLLLDGFIIDFDVSGSTAFCMTFISQNKSTGGLITVLHVADVSDPAHPIDKASLKWDNLLPISVCAVSPTKAVLGLLDWGLTQMLNVQAVDATNPAAPKLGGKFTDYYVRIASFQAAGNYLYTLGLDGFSVYSLDGVSTPTLKGRTPANGRAFDALGSRVFSLNSPLVQTLDISNPASPTLSAGSWTEPSMSDTLNLVAYRGNTVLVGDMNGKIYVLDSALNLQTSFTCKAVNNYNSEHPGRMDFDGQTLCRPTAEGYQFIDLTDPANPKLRGRYDIICGHVTAMALNGSLAYLADSQFKIVDISNPQLPVVKGSVALTTSAWSMELSGSLALMMSNFYGQNELRIYDVANPAAPTFKGRYPATHNILTGLPLGDGREMQFLKQFGVVGTRVYMADGSANLRILDISSPQSPTLTKSCPMPEPVMQIVIKGTQAQILASTMHTIYQYDLSDPLTPKLLAQYSSNDQTSMRLIPGGTAAFPSVISLDTTETPNYNGLGQTYRRLYPKSFNVLQMGGAGGSISIGTFGLERYNACAGFAGANTLCYLINGNILSAIDLTHPDAPVQKAAINLNRLDCIAASGSRALIGSTSDGVYIVDYNGKINSNETGAAWMGYQ